MASQQDSNGFSASMIGAKGLDSITSIEGDGRISLRLDLGDVAKEPPQDKVENVVEFGTDSRWSECPGLSIVIMIVGSRGDVQPYLALGQQLRTNGHRIRIATHETFREIVEDAGLEFFNIGGNPQDLMSYMVKNPGLMPGLESLTNGDIVRKRKMLTEMIHGCWQACHSPTPEGSFVADAIISNPPAFAHIHCAEALGIPLLLSFTMPWSPTTSFPHPLVNVKSPKAASWSANILSYAASECLQWQGVGDIINEFRTTTLGLDSLSLRLGAGLVDRLQIPWTYCMSPALVPKPSDWQNFIDVVGFYFLDLGTRYTPKDDLTAFLKAGEPPIYIGFGSVVVDDPKAMTQIIFEATKKAGVRALVSAGWGGLGGTTIPDHIFILGNVPHDWLFDKDRVLAVIHHGGAGTTAIGLAKGRPTVVVPFFGDQGFWGDMIHKAGAGPKPIPQKDLNVKTLRDAIAFAISPAAKKAAASLADSIRHEDGARRGAESFYRHLPLLNMRCDLDPSEVAVWWSQEHFMKLGALAAQVLVDANIISMDSLVPHRPKEYKATKMLTPAGIYATANSIFWNLTNGPISWKNRDIRGIAYSIADAFQHTRSLIASNKAKNKIKKEEKARKKAEEAAAAAALAERKLQDEKDSKDKEVEDKEKEEPEVGKGNIDQKEINEGKEDEMEGEDSHTDETEEDGYTTKSNGENKQDEHEVTSSADGDNPKETMPADETVDPEQGAPANDSPPKDRQSEAAKAQFKRIRQTRLEQGLEAFKHSTNAERTRILKKFEESKDELPIRKLKYKELFKGVNQEPESSKGSIRSPKSTPSTSSHINTRSTSSVLTETAATPTPKLPPRPTRSQNIEQSAPNIRSTPVDANEVTQQVSSLDENEVEARFNQDMDAAIKASLEESSPRWT